MVLLSNAILSLVEYESVKTSHRKLLANLECAVCCGLLCLIFSVVAYAQVVSDRGVRIDHFGNISADDAMAHLDLFAAELRKDPKVIGALVGYRSESTLPGSHLRMLFGYRRYLVESRGVRDEQLRVVDGGEGDDRFDVWLLPPGFRVPESGELTVLKPVHFDEISVGTSCEPEFSLVLYELKDALRFYATALKEHPQAKGLLFIHPSSEKSLRQARQLISQAEIELKSKYHLPPNIIVTAPEPWQCQELNFWLLPSTFTFPPGTSMEEDVLWWQLMTEAEADQFLVRRVEFLGNKSIRDNILRKKIPELNEGDVFKREILKKSLLSLSTVPGIQKVRLQDVVKVRLDHSNKTIDLVILVRPKPRGRR